MIELTVIQFKSSRFFDDIIDRLNKEKRFELKEIINKTIIG